MLLISDPTNRKQNPPNIKKYDFTLTTNRKKKKNGIPPFQVDLNGTALIIFCIVLTGWFYHDN